MDEINTEVVQVQDMNVIYQQDKALIDIQIATAKAYPRNIQRAVNNAIALVTIDEKTAATCTYSLPRGGKKISGPSVHLAKILAQLWGNLRAEAKVIDIGNKQITSQAIAFDLENNLAIKTEIKRSIWGKFGRFNDDMITVTGNAANAIALRNAIYAVIPRSIVDKVYDAALEKITGDISDESKFIASKQKTIQHLKDTYEVTEVEVLSAIGKSSINQITKEDLVTLIGINQAIKDGDTTVDSAFRGKKDEKPETTVEELKDLFEKTKESLSEKEKKDALRIIENQENLSYIKLLNLLNSKNADNDKQSEGR